MDISPKTQFTSQKDSPMDIEQETQPKATPEKPKNLPGDRSETKKRKLEEEEPEEQGWEEMGERIQLEKPPTVKRIEASSDRFIHGFCINLNWCEVCKYTELLEILEAQNWIQLFSESYNNVLAHAPLKEFCANFKNVDGVCVSRVKNKKISFDADYLTAIFGTPNEGFNEYFKGATEIGVGDVSIKEIVESIGGKVSKVQTNHNLFSPLQKVLFVFVHQAIVPRTQHRHEANHLDAVLMYCLENKIQINFPSIMIKHLTHCITNHLKVGYANLIITLIESFGISVENCESLKLQTNHFVQPRTLESRNLHVVDGVTQFIPKQSKAKEEVKVMTEDEELDKWLEGENSEEEGEKKGKMKDKEEGSGSEKKKSSAPTTGKRKSTRLAVKPKMKVGAPTFVDLSEEKVLVQGEQGTFVQETGESQSVPARESVGFAGFSSVSAALEMKNLKGTVQKLVDAQAAMVQKIETLGKMVSDLTKASTELSTTVQQRTDTISQGQADILKKLEDLVLEEVPIEDAGEEHQSTAPEA